MSDIDPDITREIVDKMIENGHWERPDPEDLAEVARMTVDKEINTGAGKVLLRYLAVQKYVLNVYKRMELRDNSEIPLIL